MLVSDKREIKELKAMFVRWILYDSIKIIDFIAQIIGNWNARAHCTLSL